MGRTNSIYSQVDFDVMLTKVTFSGRKRNLFKAAGPELTAGSDIAFSVDVVVLNSFSGNSFVGDRMIFKDRSDGSFILLETNDVYFAVFSLDLLGNIFYVFLHTGVDPIVQFAEPSALNKSLYSSFSFVLVIDHEIDSSCVFDVVDVLDDWINFVEFYVQLFRIIHKLRSQQNQLDSSSIVGGLCHQLLGHMGNVPGLYKDHHK